MLLVDGSCWSDAGVVEGNVVDEDVVDNVGFVADNVDSVADDVDSAADDVEVFLGLDTVCGGKFPLLIL